MTESTSLSLIQSVVDSQKDLIVVFKGEEHILTNSALNKFFGVSSLQDYNANFGPIVNNFVPHPLYFHKEKMQNGENWMDAIMKLDEMDRIVSMMKPTYEGSAFSVAIQKSTDEYTVVTLTDITRDLIKRIMIENHANIDEQSGAYDKKYFLQISKNYEDAAKFNEKILGVILVTIDSDKNPDFCNDTKALQEFVNSINNITRRDDMLVRWDNNKFLLIYLVDTKQNAHIMTNKLQSLICDDNGCKLVLEVQNENESIDSLIKKINSNA